MGGDCGERQNSIFQNYSHSASQMTSPQNVNAGTVAPVIVNLEVILVDSDPEEDLEQIQ